MEAFLRRVLPPDGSGGGYVVLALMPGSKPLETRGLRDIAAVVRVATRLSLKPVNVFYATGTFGATRHAADAQLKRCVFLDLDAKDFGGSKAEALKQLQLWLRATGFPPPAIFVDSGGGIHAYWPFDRNLDVASWKVLAEKLKASCLNAGFAIDPTPTADAARILRVPGTLNHKTNPPTPCRVLKDSGVSYDPAVLLQALLPKMSNALARLGAMVGDADLSLKGVDNVGLYPQVPYYASELSQKCGVVAEAITTGGSQHTEPLWRHLLGLMAFCDDGDKYIHQISSAHPGYTQAGTDAKFARVLKDKTDGKLKPILCTTFATYKGSICAACPYNGRIKTPMVLGKLEAQWFLPYQYRMADYAVEKLLKKGSGPDDPDKWGTVFPYRITDVEVYDPGHRQPMQVRATYTSKNEMRKVDFPHMMLSSSSNDGLGEEFAASRLWITGSQISEFKIFMTSWLRKMADVKAAVSVDQHGLGWGSRGGQVSFASGGKVFTADGGEHDFYCTDIASAKNYQPKGSIDTWTKAATAITSDPRQAAVVTLLTSFAAPLVVFAGVKGLTFSLYSAESGTGKSSVLRTAQAVWGHPTSGMAMIDDTQLSVVNRLGFLNSIPAYWDELRSNDSFYNFVKMIFTLGQGREKSRLTAAIKQQPTGSWDTLVTLASNERIADHVDAHIKSSDAGRVRLFEVVLPHLPPNPDTSLPQVFAALERNFGHAGKIYGRYLATHKDEAEQTVNTFAEAFRKHQATPSERFWTAFCSVIMAAAVLTKRAGLLAVDQSKLLAYLTAALDAQRTGVAVIHGDVGNQSARALFEFVDAHRERMLVVETFNGTGPSKYGNILNHGNQMPRGEILILKAQKDKIIRVNRQAWRTWVAEHLKASPSTFEEDLLSMGATKTRHALNAGVVSASGARVAVIEVDLNLPAFSVFED